MGKYVVFLGVGGIPKFNEGLRYLTSLSDQGILGDKIEYGGIFKPGCADYWFPKNERIKESLKKKGLGEGSFLIRAEIIDQSRLEKVISKFCSEYGLEYEIYEE